MKEITHMNPYERGVSVGAQFSSGEGFGDKLKRLARVFSRHRPDTLSENIAERARTEYIRTYIVDSDLPHILRWVSDQETQLHLDPLPEVPDWRNPQDVREKQSMLRDYYNDPNIVPFVSVNKRGEPLAVSSMRLKEDPFIKNQDRNRAPVFERLIVNSDPHLRHKGIGTEHTATVIQYMFDTYKGYTDENGRERGASKIFAWIMERGNWENVNWRFFRRLGFQAIGHWQEIAEKYGVPMKEDATLMLLKPVWFQNASRRDQRIRRCARIKTQAEEI